MATKSPKANQTPKKPDYVDPEEKIESALDKTEIFFQQHAKQLLTWLIVIVVIVGGYFAYEYVFARPRAVKVAEMMFTAEQLFVEENFDQALNGNGVNPGFAEIVDRYGNTRQGRLAAQYAGICCIKEGNPDAALSYLEKYKPVKGAPGVIVNAQNYGLRADIYVDRGDYAKARDLYIKAIDAADNILTTPYYMRKLALVYAADNNVAKALELCQRIKIEYFSSIEARDIDKLIGEFSQK